MSAGNAPFTIVNPGLTVSPPQGATGQVLEAVVSSYAQKYTGAALTGAVATTVGSVDNNGNAILNLNDGSYDLITVAGVVTHFTTKLGGDVPVQLGEVSVGGTYRVYLDDSEIGFLFFKNGAFVSANASSLAHAPPGVAMSPNGKYVFLVDKTANTCELWVGS